MKTNNASVAETVIAPGSYPGDAGSNPARGTFTVYGLHSGDYRFVYVGSTSLPLKERLRLHRSKGDWRAGIRAEPFEVFDNAADAFRAEAKWIAVLDTHRNGHNLTADGRGRGGLHSEDHRAAISATLTERSLSEDCKEKIRIAALGRECKEETKIKMSKAAALRERNTVCNQCGKISTAQGIGNHQRHSGHK